MQTKIQSRGSKEELPRSVFCLLGTFSGEKTRADKICILFVRDLSARIRWGEHADIIPGLSHLIEAHKDTFLSSQV